LFQSQLTGAWWDLFSFSFFPVSVMEDQYLM